MLVSNSYFKGVHYQEPFWNPSFGNNFYVPCQPCSSGRAKASQRQSFSGRKFLLVEIFPEFGQPFHSFKIFMILITYLFTWSLYHLFVQSNFSASFLSFVIQLCLQYWAKYNLLRKKNVHLISKINLPQQKDIRN